MDTAADYMNDLLLRLQRATADEAVDLLLEAADAHPADARPLLLLAAEFAQAREYDRAEAVYVAALQRAPQFTIARFQLGLLQFTSGRPAVATVTWAPLDELPEDDPLRLFKQAFECLKRDDFAGADALLKRGIANNTQNPPLNRDMQMMLERLAAQQQKPAEAPAAPGAEAEAPATAHFLVSAYKNLH